MSIGSVGGIAKIDSVFKDMSEEDLVKWLQNPDQNVPAGPILALQNLKQKQEMRTRMDAEQSRGQGAQPTTAQEILMASQPQTSGLGGMQAYHSGGAVGHKHAYDGLMPPGTAGNDAINWFRDMYAKRFATPEQAGPPPPSPYQQAFQGQSPWADMSGRLGRAYDAAPKPWQWAGDVANRLGEAYMPEGTLTPNPVGKAYDAIHSATDPVANMRRVQDAGSSIASGARDLDRRFATGVQSANEASTQAVKDLGGAIKDRAQSIGTQLELGAEATVNEIVAKIKEIQDGIARGIIRNTPAVVQKLGELKERAQNAVADTVLKTPKAMFDAGQKMQGIRSELGKTDAAKAAADVVLKAPGAMLDAGKYVGKGIKTAKDALSGAVESIPTGEDGAMKLAKKIFGDQSGKPSGEPADFTGNKGYIGGEEHPLDEHYENMPWAAEEKKTATAAPSVTGGKGIKSLPAATPTVAAAPQKTALELYKENQKALGGGKQADMIKAQRAEMKADRHSNFWNNVGIAGSKMAASRNTELAGVLGEGGLEFFTRSGEDEKDYKKQKADLRRLEMDYQGQIDKTSAAVASGEITRQQGAERNAIARGTLKTQQQRVNKVPDLVQFFESIVGKPQTQWTAQDRSKVDSIYTQTRGGNKDAGNVLASANRIGTELNGYLKDNGLGMPNEIRAQVIEGHKGKKGPLTVAEAAADPAKAHLARDAVIAYMAKRDVEHPYRRAAYQQFYGYGRAPAGPSAKRVYDPVTRKTSGG